MGVTMGGGGKWGGHDLNVAFVGFGGAGNLRKIGVCHAHKRANTI
jgi:hypothetical protein